jgi:hypothetical protein
MYGIGEGDHVQDLAKHSLIVFDLQLARKMATKENKKNLLTAIDKTTKRGEHSDGENSKVREQTLDSRRPSELGTSLRESILA